jgi:hypothetical protein
MKKKAWKPPTDLDPECLALCVAMNKLPGIQTTNSCCGHGDSEGIRRKTIAQGSMFTPDPYWIFFQLNKPEDMLPLLYWIDHCHSPLKGRWTVQPYTDCAGDRVFWMLEGPTGMVAYEDSLVIAERLEKEIGHK